MSSHSFEVPSVDLITPEKIADAAVTLLVGHFNLESAQDYAKEHLGKFAYAATRENGTDFSGVSATDQGSRPEISWTVTWSSYAVGTLAAMSEIAMVIGSEDLDTAIICLKPIETDRSHDGTGVLGWRTSLKFWQERNPRVPGQRERIINVVAEDFLPASHWL